MDNKSLEEDTCVLSENDQKAEDAGPTEMDGVETEPAAMTRKRPEPKTSESSAMQETLAQKVQVFVLNPLSVNSAVFWLL